MTSRAQKRRNKRAAKIIGQPGAAPGKKALVLRQVAKRHSNKPTAERMRRGVWIEGKAEQPDVDLASDMAGSLFHEHKITQQQLEAARAFQEVRAPYLAEYELAGFKSCLAGGVGGHDDSDGNPEAFNAYRHITRNLSPGQVRVLEVGLDMAPEQAGSLTVWKLRDALDAMGS